MAAFDERKTMQKQGTVLMQVAADALYQIRTNIFLEVLLSSYAKITNCKPCSYFNNRK